MLAFPILGVSLYLLVGLNGSTKKMRARYEEIDKKLLPYLPDNRQILEWMKKENPQAGAIASYLTNYSCYPVYQTQMLPIMMRQSKAGCTAGGSFKGRKVHLYGVSCHRRRRGMATDPDGT